ncbi:MAG: class I tRNA ligase family protein, partial [Methanoregulaceae archaeon]|nr:class I tRNA ligase family protein [Methanoregulaceae archaeon]
KMSKSLGNVVTPEEVVSSVGVDVLRMYVLSSSAPWDDLKFNWDGVKTVNRAMNIFWNVYRFPLPYMILDEFLPTAGEGGGWDAAGVASRRERMAPEDRWILSRMNTCAVTIDAALKERQLHRATRTLISFILEDLSRWYVQLVRPRMWLEGESAAKTDAYETISYVLRRLCGLLAPFTPHITEQMYRNLRLPGDPESIHMTCWFSGDMQLIDERLEEEMATVRSFDEAQANARQTGRRKLRWPVVECVVVTADDAVASAIENLNDICRDRANARTVRVLKGAYDRSGWRAEPVMKAIGPAFGKKGALVRELIAESDAASIRASHDQGETVTLSRDGESFDISPGMVTFVEELPPEIFQAQMTGGIVYIDTTLTPELEAEGYAREVIRRIQEMRRQLDLRVEDCIAAGAVIADERVAGLINDLWREGIMEEVRAAVFAVSTGDAEGAPASFDLIREWDVEGIPMVIGISQLRDKPVQE